LESTVVDCTSDAPVILRSGAVTAEALRAVVPGVSEAEEGSLLSGGSPGTRYRHYAPKARVEVVWHPADAVAGPDTSFIGISPPAGRHRVQRICGSVERYAFELFDFFRESDAAGCRTIFCQAVPAVGLGRALMDRIGRAARA
jgi:L-threonylcarbamoyladenylate synthase